MTVELPAATFSTAQLYYQDTTAGIATLSASGAGVVTGTQPFTVSGAPPVSLRVDPPTSTVLAGGTVTLRAVGVDEFGNASPGGGRLDDRAAVPRHRLTCVGVDRELRRVQRARLGRRHRDAHDTDGRR